LRSGTGGRFHAIRPCNFVVSARAGRVAVGVDPYEYAITFAKEHAKIHAGRMGENGF